MATSLSITTNFVGEVAGEYIAAMIKEANTISDNLVTVMPNIVSPVFVRLIELEDGFVNYACGWNPQGSTTLSERELAPKKIKWDAEYCKENFRQLWTAKEMGFSAHNDSLPATEQAAILMEMAKVVARKVDYEIWEGTGGDGNLDGLIPMLLADSEVLDVATPTTITASNVVAEVWSWLNTIPDAVIGADDLVLGISTNVMRAIREAYYTSAVSNATFLKPNELEFGGYVLKEIKGLAADTMVAYRRSAVFFGTGLLADHNEVRIKDMDDTDLSGNVRMKVVLTGGVQYAFGGEITLYRGSTPSV